MKITVYPTSKNACVLAHPIDGKISVEGSSWTRDGYTARCLVDGAITDDKTKAWGASAPVAAQAAPTTDNEPETRVTRRSATEK